MPFDPKAFADEISGKLVGLLEERKEEIVADAGGWARRAAVRVAWPTLIAEVPTLARTLIELAAWRFGDLTVSDLLGAIDRIKQASPPALHLDGSQVPQSRA